MVYEPKNSEYFLWIIDFRLQKVVIYKQKGLHLKRNNNPETPKLLNLKIILKAWFFHVVNFI